MLDSPAMRVLVVEDEADVADVFFEYLTELGHEATLVRSAEAALGKLHTDRPDAILLDIHLPGMSGLEFLRLRPIREAGVPVVAVSGVVTESQARECLKLGAIDFVGKPVALERLNAVLQCLEPQALERRMGEMRWDDRRRGKRAAVALPVYVTEYGAAAWHATTIDLSVRGVKLRPAEPVQPGQAARLTFALPDDGPSVTLMSLLMRRDASGITFFFVNPTSAETERLANVVAKLTRG
ncbi:MAG: response regulator [Candidatus Rokubacteria bacterium]|nr:response regulator [Candidatus Rokubacteria bacterium]